MPGKQSADTMLQKVQTECCSTASDQKLNGSTASDQKLDGRKAWERGYTKGHVLKIARNDGEKFLHNIKVAR